jgi:hypothetical protein
MDLFFFFLKGYLNSKCICCSAAWLSWLEGLPLVVFSTCDHQETFYEIQQLYHFLSKGFCAWRDSLKKIAFADFLHLICPSMLLFACCFILYCKYPKLYWPLVIFRKVLLCVVCFRFAVSTSIQSHQPLITKHQDVFFCPNQKNHSLSPHFVPYFMLFWLRGFYGEQCHIVSKIPWNKQTKFDNFCL